MEIEKALKNYQVNDEIVKILEKTKIVFLVGIMASGKDAVQKSLLETGGYKTIITHTTRPPRYNEGILEQNGVDYYFIDSDTMAGLLNSHKLIEVNRFSDNYYGTSIEEFEKATHEEKIAICNVDVNGVKSFYNLVPDNITPIFIIPPNYNVWLSRAISRYQSSDDFFEVWEKRRSFAINELESALKEKYYDFVVNDEIDEAVNLIDEIVKSNNRTSEQYQIYARQIAHEFLDAIKNTSTR